jgi:acetyl-CoA carboxylase biotin carboxyl carrier protein
MELTVEQVEQILKIFLDSEMRELRIELGDVKVVASKRDTTDETPETVTLAPERGDIPRVGTQRVESEPLGPEPARPETAPGEPQAPPVDREGLVAVTAPLLGTFYRSPSPGKPPFVEIGSDVNDQDSVCIVEVMKLFNQVPAGQKGRIADIITADGTMVEFGQTLMWIDPS